MTTRLRFYVVFICVWPTLKPRSTEITHETEYIVRVIVLTTAESCIQWACLVLHTSHSSNDSDTPGLDSRCPACTNHITTTTTTTTMICFS